MVTLLTNPARAEDPGRIKNFHSIIKINADGTVDISEQIQYDFGADWKHGIFRPIPKTKTNLDGDRFKMTFGGFSVTDSNGEPYQFKDESTAKEVVLKIGDPDNTITGVNTYVINYKVSGALTYFEDHDELFWNITGTEWPVPIDKASTTIILPEVLPSDDIGAVCYTGSAGSDAQNCEISLSGKELAIAATTEFQPKEGMTIAVSFPKGLIAQLEAQKDTPDFMTSLFYVLFVIASLAWFIFLPLYIFIKWFRGRLNTKRKQRVVAAWFDPPKHNDKTFFTPAETGPLLDKNVDHKDITATIIYLAQRGYLKIHVEKKSVLGIKKDNVKFEKLKDFDGGLSSMEKTLLTGIFSDGSLVEAKSLKNSTVFAQALRDFKKDIGKWLQTEGLFEGDINKTASLYTTLGVIAAVTFNLILVPVAFIFGRKSTRRTDLGIEKYSKAVSLRNFLESQTEQLDFQSKNQMFFERLLPYATAFGAEKVWAERFKDVKFTQPDWYDGDTANFVALSMLSHSINSSMGRSTSSFSGSRSSSGFSSGFSGGFSGGGGGGGGGGSW